MKHISSHFKKCVKYLCGGFLLLVKSYLGGGILVVKMAGELSINCHSIGPSANPFTGAIHP